MQNDLYRKQRLSARQVMMTSTSLLDISIGVVYRAQLHRRPFLVFAV